MIDISNKEYKDFIYNNILPQLEFKDINKDNIDDVYDYIVINYEITYIKNNDPRLKFIDALLNYLAQFMDFVE